jgi:hypothetical protein
MTARAWNRFGVVAFGFGLAIAATAAVSTGQTVTFDLDSGTPPPQVHQGLPLNVTMDGLTAYFSSPQSGMGGGFSIQSDGTTFYHMSRMPGNYIWPNSLSRNQLDVRFSAPLTSLTFTFATVDYQDNAEVPSNILVTAYHDVVAGSGVGSATTHAAYTGDTYPTTTLTYTAPPGQWFNLVRIYVPYNTNGTTEFLADNFIATPACAPAVVTGDPAGATLCAGGSANFVVSAGGSETLGYQWRHNGAALTDDAFVSGSLTPIMTITGTRTSDAGTYDCVVANGCGTATSAGARLIVNSADFNGDGDIGTDTDIESFFACLSGSCCATCGSADFNADGDVGTDLDIESFFRVLAGGAC